MVCEKPPGLTRQLPHEIPTANLTEELEFTAQDFPSRLPTLFRDSAGSTGGKSGIAFLRGGVLAGAGKGQYGASPALTAFQDERKEPAGNRLPKPRMTVLVHGETLQDATMGAIEKNTAGLGEMCGKIDPEFLGLGRERNAAGSAVFLGEKLAVVPAIALQLLSMPLDDRGNNLRLIGRELDSVVATGRPAAA